MKTKNSLLETEELNEQESLINKNITSEELSEKQLAEMRANFFRDIAGNNGMIFEVVGSPIDDREIRVGINTLKFYHFREIEVQQTDFRKNRGYVRINNELDLPLLNKSLTKYGPWYYYNKEEVISKIQELNHIEMKVIDEEKFKREEALNEINLARDFMNTIIEKKLF